VCSVSKTTVTIVTTVTKPQVFGFPMRHTTVTVTVTVSFYGDG
jgi:hypothetical protein